MAHFVKGDSNGNSFFACIEERSIFGFSYRGHDIAHDGGSDKKGDVVCVNGINVNVAKGMSTFGSSFRKIGGITVLFESHVAGLVSNSCIWVCCDVVKEMENFRCGLFGGFGLL